VSERILMCGNEALAEAAILAGLDAYFGYPITPQNEIPAYMSRRMPEEGRVFVQSESELAAINMVFGAAATGKRVMTSSSSPGISLMQEGMSYLAGAQMPAVVVNIMRGGPGLGNIAPSQGDYFQAVKGGGHGDYKNIVLAPASVQEMADFMPLAFELAEKYRIVVMILADGILGQMMEPIDLSKIKPPKPTDKPWALTGMKGRSQNVVKSLWLGNGVLEELNNTLQAKYRKIEQEQTRCENYLVDDADIVIVAYGIAARMSLAAVDMARESGIKAGLIRPITLWPFPSEYINRVAENFDVFLTVEMSCGQMVEDVERAVAGKSPVILYGRSGGGVPSVEEIFEQIRQMTVNWKKVKK
jgi:2-oxoglutarate ferredoxin oxidoreductase subunit alpha